MNCIWKKVDGNNAELEWTCDKDESDNLFWNSFNILLTMEMMEMAISDILFREGVKMAV